MQRAADHSREEGRRKKREKKEIYGVFSSQRRRSTGQGELAEWSKRPFDNLIVKGQGPLKGGTDARASEITRKRVHTLLSLKSPTIHTVQALKSED